MTKFMRGIILGLCLCGGITTAITNPTVAVADDIDKILKAKDIVRNMVNYPDTLVFHNLYTKVNGNTVTLKFTCKNGFGVSETHIMDIKVD
jgi:hypothetical protein